MATFDDDITRLWILVGKRPRKTTDASAIRQVIVNSSWCAFEAGASLCAFAMTNSPMSFYPYDPIGLRKAAGPVLTVIGRSVNWDDKLHVFGDCDINLQALMKDRFVYQDNRFAFEYVNQINPGGATHYRTPDRIRESKLRLVEKWGGTSAGNWKCKSSYGGTGERVVVTTKRRQSLKV